MDERELICRLESLAPQDLDGARERAKLAARVRYSSARPIQGWTPDLRIRHSASDLSLRSVRGVIVAVTCLVAIWLAAFTGPGDSLATWVGGEFGIGHADGPPPPSRLRADLNSDADAQNSPAYVLARGPAPGGTSYEFITYRSNRNEERCYELDLPEAPNTGGSSCGAELPPRAGLRVDFAGSPFDLSLAPVAQISGRTSADTAAVEVRFDERTVPAQLTDVPLQALASAGIHGRLKVFVAFLDASALNGGGSLRVVSFDRQGMELAQKTLFLPDIEAGYDRRCEELRRSGKEGRALRVCG